MNDLRAMVGRIRRAYRGLLRMQPNHRPQPAPAREIVTVGSKQVICAKDEAPQEIGEVITAKEAIHQINEARLKLPTPVLSMLARVIGFWAARDDADAKYFMFLLNWNPQQKAN